MTPSDIPDEDRRLSLRSPPTYTPEEINDLSIVRVHFRGGYLVALLSNGNMLCVPLSVSPALEDSPHLRYQWKINQGGKEVVWYRRGMGIRSAHLDLWNLLAHPEAQITQLSS